jgi:hypothetical protein
MNVQLFKSGCVTAAALVALTPISSHATQSRLMDACIKTFVDRYAPKDRRVVDIRKPRLSNDLYEGFRPQYTIHVRARGATTGETFGSATCIVNSSGTVLEMYVDGAKVDLADTGRPTAVRVAYRGKAQ